MIFYRAMCVEEFNKTTPNSLSFIRRYKWMTPNLDFLYNRVMGGNFNNSDVKCDRYTHIVKIICDISNVHRLNDNEYIIDRRNNVRVDIEREVKYSAKNRG